jgi:large subunit ribosomal protein L31
MKNGIHPKLNTITVNCACGYKFETHSTLDKLVVEICSNCHPFYTGQERFVDTEGRIDKFNRKRNLAQNNSLSKKAEKTVPLDGQYKPTLKDIFNQSSNN